MTSYTVSMLVSLHNFTDDGHYKFNHNFSSLLKVMMVTVITVNITNFNNHYHVVILKIVSITMFCSDVNIPFLQCEEIYTLSTFMVSIMASNTVDGL